MLNFLKPCSVILAIASKDAYGEFSGSIEKSVTIAILHVFCLLLLSLKERETTPL